MKAILVLVLILAIGNSALGFEGGCPPVSGEAMQSRFAGCVVFDRSEARYLGVPRRLKVRALVGCQAKNSNDLLVFGLDRQGRVKCQGWGQVEGGDFEACGLLW